MEIDNSAEEVGVEDGNGDEATLSTMRCCDGTEEATVGRAVGAGNASAGLDDTLFVPMFDGWSEGAKLELGIMLGGSEGNALRLGALLAILLGIWWQETLMGLQMVQ